jgi:hypothetical protein
MTIENGMTNAPGPQICLASFKKHWAEAQIDGPAQAIARYDDVAKLLITIGGFVLATMAGGYSAVIKSTPEATNLAYPKRMSPWILFFMFLFFLSAALTCFWQPKIRALKILEAEDDDALKCEIKDWCTNMGRILNWKKACLISATIFFVVSFLLMMWVLLNL